MDRRELLRRFGIGAIIAPVVGGLVLPGVTAELIQVPKVRPVELFTKIPEPLDLREVTSAVLTVIMKNGTSRTMEIPNIMFHGSRHIGPFDLNATIELWHAASPSLGDGVLRGVGSVIVL